MIPKYTFCGYCGKKNQTSYNFCTGCGKPVEKLEEDVVDDSEEEQLDNNVEENVFKKKNFEKPIKKSEDDKNINTAPDIDLGEDKENADNLENQGETKKKATANGQPRLSQFFKLSWLPFFLSFILVLLNFLGAGSLGIDSHVQIEKGASKAVLGIFAGLIYGFISYWGIGSSFFNRLIWAFWGSIYLVVVFGAAGFSFGCAFGVGGFIGAFFGGGLGTILAITAINTKKEIIEAKKN